jgi:ABC-type multidrug transport system ATPase subunit
MTVVITADGLSRSYGGRLVLEKLALHVPRGSVFGFLGPNGAGKTTTIRLLLGLQRPTAGRAEVLGHPAGDPRALGRIGALVEVPSLYPNLTGLENLRVTAHYRGCDEAACRKALDLVSLAGAAHQTVKGYSLGMKQRLAIALALMHEPELLILDEPTNGLDPAGILEVRALMRSLVGRSGVTIFLSSHLLTEVEQVATHLAILNQGRLQFQGTLKAFRERSRPRLLLGLTDVSGASDFLRGHGIVSEPLDDGRLRIDATEKEEARQINELLVRSGFGVSHLALERPSLEDQFLEMTQVDA